MAGIGTTQWITPTVSHSVNVWTKKPSGALQRYMRSHHASGGGKLGQSHLFRQCTAGL